MDFVEMLAVVLAIAALVRANDARRHAASLLGRITALERELRRLRSPDLAVRPAVPSSEKFGAESASPPRAARSENDPPQSPPLQIPAASAAEESSARHPAETAISPPFPDSPGVSQIPNAALDWEQFMGAKLFAWIGGLALFLGVGFFVKYSFEHNLIPPEWRVAIGFGIGLALLAGGLLVRRPALAVLAQTLCATGVLILYAVTFSCRNLYHFPFFGTAQTFVLMALITAAAFVLAVRLGAPVVAVLGMLGGFLTPVLLATGEDHPGALFGYIAFLDAGLLAVALRRRWNYLAPLGALGTVLMELGWAGRFFVPEEYFASDKILIAMAVLLGFTALFAGAVFIARRREKMSRRLTWSAHALAAVAFCFACSFLTFPPLALRPGLIFSFVFLIDLAVLAVVRLDPRSANAQPGSGLAVFLLLAMWTQNSLTPETLNAALALYFVFAVFHSAAPHFLQRPRGLLSGCGAVLPFVLLIMVTARLPIPDPSPIFGLALLLVALLLGVAKFLAVELLSLAGLLAVLALEHAWHSAHFVPPCAAVPLLWYLAFSAVFTVFPFLFRADFRAKNSPWIAAALAGPLHFGLIHALVKSAYPNPAMGLLPAALAVPSLCALALVARDRAVSGAARTSRLAWFGGAALFFLTLIFPIQFDREWITIGWALEGAALCWLFRRVAHPGLRLAGVAMLLAAFARLALNPAVLQYHARAAGPIFNWYLYAYGSVAACLFAAARWLAPPRHLVLGKNAPPWLAALGTVLIFLFVNLEIADCFTPAGAPVLTLEFSHILARDLSYSVAWALFALLLVGLGIARRLAPVRHAGLALLTVTLAKLFLHDLARLDALYRIAALVIVALVAIVASFLYQRFFPPEVRRGEAPPAI